MAVRWPMVGVKTLTGCSPVFLYWEFRVRSFVIILSSAKHFNWGPGTTPLCLWLLYFAFIPLWFMLGSSARYLRVCLWRLKNLAVGWRWRWVCLETVCDQFWHALPLTGVRCRPRGANSVNGGRKGELLTLVKGL